MKYDPWQEKFLKTKGNKCIRSGRQVGKSTVVAKDSGEYAAHNRNKNVMVIAATERQAYLLFEKILSYCMNNYRGLICKGKDRPTKSKLKLTNGSTIYCLPTGLSGYGIRGYTIHRLIADEAAFIPEAVWDAVTPMLATTKGDIVLLSTPFGKGTYFYNCFFDVNFTQFHVSSEDCPRIDKEFLKREKETKSNMAYAQEYLGEFVDELLQFFPTELIEKVMILQKETPPNPIGKNFLGVDVARMGGDETVLLSLQMNGRHNKLKMTDLEISKNTYLTETVRRIKNADNKNKYNKIYIDDGGLGVGVFDPLLEDNQTKRKVVAINNASRSIDREEKRKRLLKEDLYNNLLVLMERGQIQLWKDADIMLSLKSVQCEYNNGKLKIFGRYTHIAEALIRAAWCTKDKRLNIWVA
ncbi:MAG: hypothetical protein CMI54_00775 [Parcubacteria group bacterium]|nr:hypothetical protein [Parcubacteria group bacterium]